MSPKHTGFFCGAGDIVSVTFLCSLFVGKADLHMRTPKSRQNNLWDPLGPPGPHLILDHIMTGLRYTYLIHSPKSIPIRIGIPSWIPNSGWNYKLNTDLNWNSKLNCWSVGRVYRSVKNKLWFNILSPFKMHWNVSGSTQYSDPAWCWNFLKH